MNVLSPFGMSSHQYSNKDAAIYATYIDNTGKPVPTRLNVPENPYINEIINADVILDLGCGIGRNLPWIMDNTHAEYIGLEPNDSMRRFFWDVQEHKHKRFVTLCKDFQELDIACGGSIIDAVVCTFVLQHLTAKLTLPGIMGRNEITQKVMQRCKPGAVWFLYESEYEEEWVRDWARACNIHFDVLIKDYRGLPELTHRENADPATHHHLMIFRT